MKKIFIKLICILLVVVCVFSITNGVDATSNIIKSKFKGNSGSEGSEAIKQILSAVLSVVRTIGAVIAVLMLMTIGAKYIVASAGDRADIKKYAINYVIGAVVLLGATGILSVIKNLVDESLK
ncbi:MAG: hypothetical protein IJW20_01295 [Clostridia bacterium]|nr:hypothetical protein [Clostridia bacterium]